MLVYVIVFGGGLLLGLLLAPKSSGHDYSSELRELNSTLSSRLGYTDQSGIERGLLSVRDELSTIIKILHRAFPPG